MSFGTESKGQSVILYADMTTASKNTFLAFFRTLNVPILHAFECVFGAKDKTLTSHKKPRGYKNYSVRTAVFGG